MLSIQFFECLNVAAQSLGSSYLGSGDIPQARAVMVRLATLAALVGTVAGLLVFTGCEPLVRIFTSDPAVIAQVGAPGAPGIGGGAAAWTRGKQQMALQSWG